MIKFFDKVIDKEIINESLSLLNTIERSRIRSLRSNLRANEKMRSELNSRKISISQILEMNHEDLANEEVRKKREATKKMNLRDAIVVKEIYSKEELNVLLNKIEDP